MTETMQYSNETEEIQYLVDLPDKLRRLDRNISQLTKMLKERMKAILEVADKLDSMSDDLMMAGISGYGLSLKSHAKAIRNIVGVIR